MELENIAVFIKEKRKERNLTQVELAKKLYVTEKAISRWETGRGTPDVSLLLPLADALGVTVSEILLGKVDKKLSENIKEIIEYVDVSKKKKNTKCLFVSVIIYLVTLLFYLAYLKDIYSGFLPYTDYAGAIKIYVLFSVSILIAQAFLTNYYDKIEDREKVKKISYVILFVLYIIMVFNLTIFGRQVGETRYNLIPFQTIGEYIFHANRFNRDIVLVNLFGNIGIFMPVQYFVLKIFSLKKFSIVFSLDFLFVFLVEALQYFTQTGIFDVDDIFLNLLGMLLAFFGISWWKKISFKFRQ